MGGLCLLFLFFSFFSLFFSSLGGVVGVGVGGSVFFVTILAFTMIYMLVFFFVVVGYN